MTENGVLVLILVILILFSGLFSAIETAYSSANRIRLMNMEDDGEKRAKSVLQSIENFDSFLTTILIANNIVNIGAATIGTVLFTRIYGNRGATISTIVITVIVLLFGEITPKSLAKKVPERFACSTAGFVRFITIVLLPVSWIFRGWRKMVDKIIKVEEDDSDIADELITMVDEAEREGDLEEHESDLISAAIEFNDLDVRDVLTPRVDVIALPVDISLDEAEKIFRLNAYSRLPVYEGSIDTIIGVVHEKDFYNLLRDNSGKKLDSIIQPVLNTSENVKISTLLKQLQLMKLHMAIVLDEYGGTAGIITLEDIIEELVGEIWDEHDTVVEHYRQLADNVFLVKGDTDFEDMLEYFGMEDDEEEYDFITVSGWVIDSLEHIPAAGESFDFRNLHVTVTKADLRRVLEVRAEIQETEEEEDD